MNSPHELSTLVARLRQLRADDFAGGAALTTIVATRGSTFRRTGTSMLVLGDASVVCALSGGCPQRDITERALQVIASGIASRVVYNQDFGLDLLIEMGCGGELDVLIEPIISEADLHYLDALADALTARRPFWMATVFPASPGKTFRHPRRLLWHEQAVLHDGLDNAILRETLRTHPQRPASSGHPVRVPVDGGQMAMLERQLPSQALLVVGAGAAADALAPLSRALGWEVCVVDGNPQRLAVYADRGLTTLLAAPAALIERARIDRYTAVVVMTHNLQQDIAYLDALADSPASYLGVLGSRERVAAIRAGSRVPAGQLHAPAGLNLGSEAPAEIALAITAEILAARNSRDGRPLRDTHGPIH